MIKKILTPIIKYSIDKAKRNKFIQNLFESPFELNKLPIKGKYKDSKGHSYVLYDELRTKIRPSWKLMFIKDAETHSSVINTNSFKKLKSDGEVAVKRVESILELFGKKIEGSSILEVGCHFGGTAFSFAEHGASKVVGTEFLGYKVKSIDDDGKLSNKILDKIDGNLEETRVQLSKYFKGNNKVEFVNDNICNSELSSNSFDFICSWDVLEHIDDTQNAFKSIHRLLKDDGVSIHEYNPFFCINGGHSLCTLDMLWGHTQLSESDFIDYLEKYRPEEKEMAYSFYKNGINRMTLEDLRTQLKEANLEILSILPFTKEQHVRMVNKDILGRTKLNYPNATLLDLTAPKIYVAIKKMKTN